MTIKKDDLKKETTLSEEELNTQDNKKEKIQALTIEDLEEVSGGWSWSGFW